MARPPKQGMDYFPHDCDAAQDEKIEAMRSMFGNDGYAFYFISLERIYRTDNASLDLSKEIFRRSLATKLMVPLDKLDAMIDASIDIGLFCHDAWTTSQCLTSNGIKKRAEDIMSMRNKWRSAKQDIPASFPPSFPLRKPSENPSENPVENAIKESKVNRKESKENKSKENQKEKQKYADFVFLFEFEYLLLIEKYSEPIVSACIEKLNAYKGANNKQYDSDYHAIISWVVKNVQTEIEEQLGTPKKQPSKPSAPATAQPGMAWRPPNKDTPKPILQVAQPPPGYELPTPEELEDIKRTALMMDELSGGGR